jgi:hypothetical protein
MSFHVPELARNTTHPQLGTTSADGNNGAFDIESPEPGWRLALICSDGIGWDHVSVHAYRGVGRQQRTPNWREMSYVKDLCWDDEDIVMQLHPRRSEYVNNHPHVLHLWRPTRAAIPTPPSFTVGIASAGTLSPIDPEAFRKAEEGTADDRPRD